MPLLPLDSPCDRVTTVARAQITRNSPLHIVPFSSPHGLDFIYDELKPLILKNEKMVNGEFMEKVLLPKSIILDRATGEFKFKTSNGEFKAIKKREEE
jgi:hypothetical protein